MITRLKKAGWLLAAASALAAQPRAGRFPESDQDSESIRDEQYWQMDRYFEQQIAPAVQNRARYWSRLDFSSAANFDRAADAYRQDWAQYLGMPDPGGAPLNVKRIMVREFDG